MIGSVSFTTQPSAYSTELCTRCSSAWNTLLNVYLAHSLISCLNSILPDRPSLSILYKIAPINSKHPALRFSLYLKCSGAICIGDHVVRPILSRENHLMCYVTLLASNVRLPAPPPPNESSMTSGTFFIVDSHHLGHLTLSGHATNIFC